MQGYDSGEVQECERFCQCCKQCKPLEDFERVKGNRVSYRKICSVCEGQKQLERRQRVAIRREVSEQEWEAKRKVEWERMVALREEHEAAWRARDLWYQQQPDRCCRSCRQVLPAAAFGGACFASSMTLYTRCKRCHELLRERHQLACCLCQRRLPRADFLAHFNGYALCGDGTWISLCCKDCEATFRTLSDEEQRGYIRACCMRAFPTGQVIYAECDPQTQAMRYIGRTCNPHRRHAQHLIDVSSHIAEWGSERITWYTRSNWMQSLADKGLAPSMQILRQVEVPQLVVEWELRFIWHGIQQGWQLLNIEAVDASLVAHIRDAQLDFLQAPFELLVEQQFFPARGLAAFLRQYI